ncbi:AcrR family transcriptional regulator [Kibdelosporangium banguiense]|uniref:AcrR family transcriptional regulator n=1 Tax=Kibdelosporangium banguiense TaxID=1365924 RepID=A0ABS4TZW5_9PSEU|nr:TetR/AcrR family transcriptional regulator [Kibdelosporangium banguiense]MBP2329456.1 AcrR family transcriptional regulator [Kibdelosporangium banguiense]
MTGGDLRAARRRATTLNIETIAVELALEMGSDAVTVEAICERALISPRTFYNYFTSRDAALIGEGWPQPSPESVARFLAGGTDGLLSDLVELCAGTGPKTEAERVLLERRMKLIEQEPAWAEKSMANFGEALDMMANIVLSRLETAGRSVEDEPDLYEVAKLSVMLTGAVLHTTTHGNPMVGEVDREEMNRVVDLARRTMKGML